MDPILFGPFCLDLDQRRVSRDGTDLKVRPQAVRVLRVLSQHAGQPVSYEQLLKEAWDSTFVSRHTVATTVSEIRKAFEEYGSWIEYRPRIGYSLKVPRSDDQIRTGWHLSERRTREGLEKALACFEQASHDDPSDHRAYEGASRMYLMLGMYGMRILGANGYSKDFPVERYYRDAPLVVIGGGTNELQRLIIARNLLKKYKDNG
jgi:DNA-binding winged helix-turn-helix (wHTH) protein